MRNGVAVVQPQYVLQELQAQAGRSHPRNDAVDGLQESDATEVNVGHGVPQLPGEFLAVGYGPVADERHEVGVLLCGDLEIALRGPLIPPGGQTEGYGLLPILNPPCRFFWDGGDRRTTK